MHVLRAEPQASMHCARRAYDTGISGWLLLLLCAAQTLLKRYPEILRNLRPLPGSLDIRDIPRSEPWGRQRRRQQQQHWLSAAAEVLPVNQADAAAAGQQQQKVKRQPGLPSQDELQVSPGLSSRTAHASWALHGWSNCLRDKVHESLFALHSALQEQKADSCSSACRTLLKSNTQMTIIMCTVCARRFRQSVLLLLLLCQIWSCWSQSLWASAYTTCSQSIGASVCTAKQPWTTSVSIWFRLCRPASLIGFKQLMCDRVAGDAVHSS